MFHKKVIEKTHKIAHLHPCTHHNTDHKHGSMLLDLVQPSDYFSLEGQIGVVELGIQLCAPAARLCLIHGVRELAHK